MNELFLKVVLKAKYSKVLNKFVKYVNDAEKEYHLTKQEPVPSAKSTIDGDLLTIKNKIISQAKLLYNDDWNYYSDALLDENIDLFNKSCEIIKENFESFSYLEIGSAQGLSMTLNGCLMHQKGKIESLVSLDPYFKNGYSEGIYAPWEKQDEIKINKSTKEKAAELYNSLNLNVQQIEKKSFDGLIQLLENKATFNYIYIDGYHENFTPLQDLGLCFELLNEGGILLLDDYSWKDVEPLVEICDRHMTRLFSTWKIVAFMKKKNNLEN